MTCQGEFFFFFFIMANYAFLKLTLLFIYLFIIKFYFIFKLYIIVLFPFDYPVWLTMGIGLPERLFFSVCSTLKFDFLFTLHLREGISLAHYLLLTAFKSNGLGCGSSKDPFLLNLTFR